MNQNKKKFINQLVLIDLANIMKSVKLKIPCHKWSESNVKTLLNNIKKLFENKNIKNEKIKLMVFDAQIQNGHSYNEYC